MSWSEHAIWWQVYPLGFVGAPIRERDRVPQPHRLARVTAWLDHLIHLGANGLLLGPVFASASHGYDTLDYFQIDPRLGDDDDFAQLVNACHERGIRVCLDGVFNHVSVRHPFVVDALANGPSSRYADWFRIDWDVAGGPRPAVFEGHSALVELNHENPDVQEYVVDVLAHWSARGVDAWRLDAAYAVSPRFWGTVLPRVRAAFPDIWIFGEVIHGDYRQFVAESTADSVTQYELWKAIRSSLADQNFFELDWALQRHNGFLDGFLPATFVGNHDVTRIATAVGQEKAGLALVILLTVGGIPSIFAGDEYGMTGVKEEREGGDDAIRPEFPPAPVAGAGEPTLRLYQDLIGLRRRYPWLRDARTSAVDLTNTRYVYIPAERGGPGQLSVELDVGATPSARIRDIAGSVLFSYPR